MTGREQVEKLLALSYNRNFDWCSEAADAFPDVARHYLALLDEREAAQAYILALRQILYAGKSRFDANDLASKLEVLRQRSACAGSPKGEKE